MHLDLDDRSLVDHPPETYARQLAYIPTYARERHTHTRTPARAFLSGKDGAAHHQREALELL